MGVLTNNVIYKFPLKLKRKYLEGLTMNFIFVLFHSSEYQLENK
jgi:hypothetical protein